MSYSSQDNANVSPWSSGSWHTDPKQIALLKPSSRREVERGHIRKAHHRALRGFGKAPESDLLRFFTVTLFAFSGALLAAIAFIYLG